MRAGDVQEWSDDVDVVVVGFGIAGGCAAVSAAAAGARVLVLEKAAAAGGSTAMAGGHFYLGGGTAVQEATGNPDTADEMYKYLVAVSSKPDRAGFAHTATEASSTSTGWRTWAFSSNVATAGTRWSSRRAPRDCRTRAMRRYGRLRAGKACTARALRAGAG